MNAYIAEPPKLRIVKRENETPRHARRSCPAIPAGTTLWYIYGGGRFFTWTYIDRDQAVVVAQSLITNWRPTDWDFNFVSDPEKAVHSFTSPNCLEQLS